MTTIRSSREVQCSDVHCTRTEQARAIRFTLQRHRHANLRVYQSIDCSRNARVSSADVDQTITRDRGQNQLVSFEAKAQEAAGRPWQMHAQVWCALTSIKTRCGVHRMRAYHATRLRVRMQHDVTQSLATALPTFTESIVLQDNLRQVSAKRTKHDSKVSARIYQVSEQRKV